MHWCDVIVADDEDDDGLSGGAIAGIVVGVVVAFVLVFILVVIFIIRRRNRGRFTPKQISMKKVSWVCML